MARRFQFNLRFVLLLSALIAFGLAILANCGHRQRQAIAIVERLGGVCMFDHRFIDENYRGPGFRIANRSDLWAPVWLRRLIGDEYFSDVTVVSLHDTAVTDSDLASLSALTKLQVLDVGNTSVTEQGLAEFRQRLPPVQVMK